MSGQQLTTTQESGTGIQMTTAVSTETTGGNEKILVYLGRPGVGVKKYKVPQGSTIDALLEAASATNSNQDIMIGPDKVQGSRVLAPNDIIFMVPKPKNA
jgi:hypothetical protein